MMNLSCSSQKSDSFEIKYFQSWGGYTVPKKPQYEIKPENISEYSTYYKAYYKDGLLVKFEKYTNEELISCAEYIYWEGTEKLKQHISVNEDGEKRIHNYNKRGKKIED